MIEEDNPRVSGASGAIDNDKMDVMHEDELARERVFDQTGNKFEGAFQYQQVWSETLMNQVQLSIHRFFKYLDS